MKKINRSRQLRLESIGRDVVALLSGIVGFAVDAVELLWDSMV